MSDSDVQPAEAPEAQGAPEGQGEAEGAGLYDLTSVPEELRPHVENQLKEFDANVTRKFQENSETLKAWEPYEELGINNIEPEALGELLEFAQMAQDDDAFAEWWKDTGERLGLFEGVGDDDELDLSDEELDALSPGEIRKMIAEQVAESTQPLYERQELGEQQRAEQEAASEIAAQLDQFAGEHEGLDRDAVLRLAYAYADEDPDNALTRGLEDYLKLVGQGEGALFADKANQPPPVEGAGAAATTPEAVTTFEEAKPLALERLRASNAA